MKLTITLCLLLCAPCARASLSAPIPPLYGTNRTAQSLVAALNVPTNGGPANGANFTNLNAANISGTFIGHSQVPVYGYQPNNIEEMGGNNLVFSFFGTGFQLRMTNTFYATNILFNAAAYSGVNRTNAFAFVFLSTSSNAAGFNFNAFSTPANYSNVISLPQMSGGAGYHATNDPVNLRIPQPGILVTSNQWMTIVLIATTTNQYSVAAPLWDTGQSHFVNYGQAWQPFVIDATGNVYSGGGYATHFSPSFTVTGYTNAATASGLVDELNSLSALTGGGSFGVSNSWDLIWGPSPPSKTIVAVMGDSKGVGLGNVLAVMPPFNSVAWFTNVAVGSTVLQDLVTNQWPEIVGLSPATGLADGTNRIAIIFGGNNDIRYSDVSTNILLYSNLFTTMTHTGWFPVVVTVNPQAGVASSGGDTAHSQLFMASMDNWLRNSPLVGRIVDADKLLSNPYDTNYFADSVHHTGQGYTNIANAILDQLYSPVAIPSPQQWVMPYGTNVVVAAPPSTNGVSSLLAFWNAGGLELVATNGPAVWPPAPRIPGDVAIVFSNTFPYILLSTNGAGGASATWTGTNQLGWH